MVRQLNNKEILEKVDEIINYIRESNSYKNYRKAKELMYKDKELLVLIDNIKIYQKKMIKELNQDENEKKLKDYIDKLNDNPLYLEYLTYQEELNNMLIIFENKINKYFFDVFNQVVYE